jgi:hypothetical protein
MRVTAGRTAEGFTALVQESPVFIAGRQIVSGVLTEPSEVQPVVVVNGKT